MSPALKHIFLNSFFAFVSAFTFTTIIHESGHFLSYFFFSAHPILFHNAVYTPDQSLSLYIRIVSALAGPFISFIQGIIFALILTRRQHHTSGYLLILWLSLLGFINFFGYLLLTPLSTTGDTGKVAELLNLSYVTRIFIAVFGVSILIVIILKMGRYFANFIPNDTEITKKRRYVNLLIMYPILAGSVVNVLLAFPIPVFLSVVYPATSSFVIMSCYGAVVRTKGSFSESSIIEKRISPLLIVFLASGILLNRLLTLGIG